jgi:hypothetical protein
VHLEDILFPEVKYSEESIVVPYLFSCNGFHLSPPFGNRKMSPAFETLFMVVSYRLLPQLEKILILKYD